MILVMGKVGSRRNKIPKKTLSQRPEKGPFLGHLTPFCLFATLPLVAELCVCFFSSEMNTGAFLGQPPIPRVLGLGYILFFV